MVAAVPSHEEPWALGPFPLLENISTKVTSVTTQPSAKFFNLEAKLLETHHSAFLDLGT